MRAFAHHLTFVRIHFRYFTTALIFTIALLSANVFSEYDLTGAQAKKSTTEQGQPQRPVAEFDLNTLPSCTVWLADLRSLLEVCDVEPFFQPRVLLAREHRSPAHRLCDRPPRQCPPVPNGTI